nr:hypothetical protein GCM10020092_035140 [Actinoplanes digitatis]
MLGRRFPLALLHAVSGLDDRALLNHLHGEDAGRLVAPDEQTPDWYAFQHPLLGEAVLQLLAPGHRVVLARRAADAIAATYPGLPDEWCQVSASLRLQAQEPGAAARHYLEAGRRALAQGAASSAVDLLDRTRELLDGDPDQLAHATAIEALVSALAEAGLMERALDLANRLDVAPDGPDRRRRAELHTRLAWAANLAGRTADGLSQVALARAALGPDAPDEATAPIDVVEAHVMLDLPGPERFTVIETMTRRAAAVAEAVPLPEVACQAWQLLGALSRRRDLAEATACLERARAIAVRHHLPIWEIHALVRLGQDEALRNGGIALLEQTRQAALRCGAVTAGYHADTNIALHTVLHGDFAAAGPLIDRTLGATTRLKMIETTQLLLLSRAILGAHQGSAPRDERRHRRVPALGRRPGPARAPRTRPGPRVLRPAGGGPRARRRGTGPRAAAGRRQRQRAPERRTRPRPAAAGPRRARRRRPGAGREGRAAAALRWNRQFALLAQAILAGRAGRADDATAAFGEALLAAAPYATARHLCLRLGGEAALRDGWGDPVAWLRAAEEHFHAVGVVPVSSACRALLRQAGAVVNQRRTGAEDLPRELRAAGVTVREYEVLRLLVERLGNREIAGRLHLSPRTVEKHVASLIAKTGQANRIVLGEFAGEFVS